MMEQVTDREVLRELVERPIGSPALQREAQSIDGTQLKPSFDLKEASQRACKKWLPAGKRSTRGPDADAREAAFYERQTDLEDAVAAAGGERGGLRP